jgi:hypothetical protein
MVTMPEIDLTKLSFRPTLEEISEAKDAIREILKEYFEIEDLEEKLSTPILASTINERAKKMIRTKRIFAIVKTVVDQITYTKEIPN